jgi:hypothetical protein
MKNFTMLSMIAVAALTVAAGSASAQTYKAQIPMAFHAGRTLLAPGTYNFEVRLAATGHDVLMIRRSDDSKLVAYVIPIAGSDAPKSWREKGNPIIAFECAGHDCTLRQLWRGQDVTAFAFPAPKLAPAAAERASIVTFALTKAD